MMTPLLARIIAQGVAEGIFRTPDPAGTAGWCCSWARPHTA